MLVADRRVSSTIEKNLYTQGDALLLRHLCNNLLSNALRYGRPGGRITVGERRLVEGKQEGVEVLFADATVPIARDASCTGWPAQP